MLVPQADGEIARRAQRVRCTTVFCALQGLARGRRVQSACRDAAGVIGCGPLDPMLARKGLAAVRKRGRIPVGAWFKPGPLADRPFRLLWLAATSSAVGSAFMPVALAFAVLSLRGNATSLGLVLLTGTVAGLVSYLVAGVWADRLARRNLMLAADLIRLAVQALVATLLLTGLARIWQLAAAYALTSIASSFFDPASTSLVAEIVPVSRLQKANSLLSISANGAMVVGPALSGLLVATAGAGWSYAVDSASFAGSAAFLVAMPAIEAIRPARRRFLSELAEGWREVTARSWVWLNLAAHAVFNLASATFFVLGPVLAARRLGGATGWGLISAGLAAGSLIGGLIAMWVKTRRPLVLGNLAPLPSSLPMFALAAWLPLPVIVAFAVVGGIGGIILNMSWATVVQQLIPNEVLARVRSYDYLLAFVAIPAGYALAGPLAATFGADRVLTAAAGLMVLSPAVIAGLPAVRAVTRHEDGRITEPRLKTKGRAG